MTQKTAKAQAVQDVQVETQKNTEEHRSHFDDTVGIYTATQVADHLEIKVGEQIRPATLRTRWMPYVIEAIGRDRACPDGLYSSLALHLIVRFYREIVAAGYAAKAQGIKAKAWVKQVTDDYAATPESNDEYESVEAEIVDDAPGAMALRQPSTIDKYCDRLDAIALFVAEEKRRAEAEQAALLIELQEDMALREEHAAMAKEKRKLAIQRAELARIKAEREAEAEAEEWREEIRGALGK